MNQNLEISLNRRQVSFSGEKSIFYLNNVKFLFSNKPEVDAITVTIPAFPILPIII